MANMDSYQLALLSHVLDDNPFTPEEEEQNIVNPAEVNTIINQEEQIQADRGLTIAIMDSSATALIGNLQGENHFTQEETNTSNPLEGEKNNINQTYSQKMGEPKSPSALDDRIRQLQQETGPSPGADARERMEFDRMNRLSVKTTSGDTLVIVKFPTSNPPYVNCEGRKWETKTFYMKSEKLLGTGSAVFKDLLADGAQSQMRRRLHLSFNDQSSQPAKFVLDLTPEDEGDDFAQMMIQLSLSQGVIDWWTSRDLIGVAKYLVSGHDDSCPSHLLVSASHSDNKTPGSRIHRSKNIADIDYPVSRKIPDYCPIRHRATILRLLIAIEHNELVLNSAQRVVTMAGIAKIFNCERFLQDHFAGWFLADPNTEFIQVNTEDALKIGWALELPSITRAAFQILVVERAVNILRLNPGTETDESVTFGRIPGRLTDEQETCVQHAAQSLAERATYTWNTLRSPYVADFLDLKYYRKYAPLFLVRDEWNWLPKYTTGLVNKASSCSQNQDYVRNELSCYIRPSDFISTSMLLKKLKGPEHLLTRELWVNLSMGAGHSDHLELKYASEIESFNLLHSDLPFNSNEFIHESSQAFWTLRKMWNEPPQEMESLARDVPWVLGLTEHESKFLPLWAGGSNDDSGHIFQPDIPAAEGGVPIGPGPFFHTGQSLAGYTESTVDSEAVYTGCGTATMTEGFSIMPMSQIAVESRNPLPHDSEANSMQLLSAASAKQEDVLADGPRIDSTKPPENPSVSPVGGNRPVLPEDIEIGFFSDDEANEFDCSDGSDTDDILDIL
ncbi:hypothetical protein F5Y16DRAFT_3138 [Xylariaceae sp. FL0255]|nr:hypothetical protein F5Y16DRAFT_3138 [Xylariaceae sp. FL0255]